MSTQTFGQLLRQARLRAGLRQADLARNSECGQSFISKLELGHRYPLLEHVIDMAETVGASHRETIAMFDALIGGGHLVRLMECACDECRGLR